LRIPKRCGGLLGGQVILNQVQPSVELSTVLVDFGDSGEYGFERLESFLQSIDAELVALGL
jgi:hypothetical protein